MIIIKSNKTGFIYPADRCFWKFGDDGIEVAHLIIGEDKRVEIPEPVLGYIGKSGHFVRISPND